MLATLVATTAAVAAIAIPADPRPSRVAQPDGDSLTVVLNGDEFYHYYTTTDGYTLLPTAGGYCYARRDGERLVSTGVMAHDARRASEMATIAALPHRLIDKSMVSRAHELRARRDSRALPSTGLTARAPRRIPGADFDYSNFRGLIILINYNDKKFTRDKAFYDEMVNTEGYNGFTHSGQRKRCVGSMRDYFEAQSNGAFVPQFDIYGPVDVDYPCTKPHGTDDTFDIFADALRALDDEVDFSQYDTNGDGIIDMVYFITAGYSANYGGNNQGYLWPHAYYLINWTQTGYETLDLDGCSFWRYACSTEIYGWESAGHTVPLGIGTMCHEFSHVLGLPDLYDTNYETDGQSVHPGEWDVMSGGSGIDEGRTPVGYSIWERYTLGFAEPQVLNEAGEYTLNELQSTREGFLLPTVNEKEYFLFENRQKTGWDTYLPGHGMLVARVDESVDAVWEDNTVNATAGHNYYELLHADGGDDIGAGNAFPGTSGVTRLNNFTTPSLLTWDQSPSPIVLQNIAERGGVITFNAISDDSMQSVVEDFETMPVTTEQSVKGVKGRWATWNLTKAAVTEIEDGKQGNGSHAVAMIRPSQLQMTTPIDCDYIYRVTLHATNTAAAAAKLVLYTSVDEGVTWVSQGAVTIAGQESTTAAWNIDFSEPVLLRVNMTSGTTAMRTATFIDDLTVHYTGEMRHDDEGDPLDVNSDGRVDVGDVNAILAAILAGNTDAVLDVNGDGRVDVGDVNTILDAILSSDQ